MQLMELDKIAGAAVEKPLTLTIDEGRCLVEVVRSGKIIRQTGTQQRSSRRFRMACEAIRNGRIGKLKEATVWLPAGLREGPFQAKPIPAELNWGECGAFVLQQ